MSEKAYQEADAIDKEQARRHFARGIFKQVESALNNQHSSGVRWPFELLQNAHDFGAREGEDCVNVEFSQEGENLVVVKSLHMV